MAGMVIPSIEFTSLAPSIILALAGILLLTVVSVTKDRLPVWFSAVWTISASVAAWWAAPSASTGSRCS
jgi:hypothetical protein